MPEHVHVSIDPREPVYQISPVLQAVKGPVAQQAVALGGKKRRCGCRALPCGMAGACGITSGRRGAATTATSPKCQRCSSPSSTSIRIQCGGAWWRARKNERSSAGWYAGARPFPFSPRARHHCTWILMDVLDGEVPTLLFAIEYIHQNPVRRGLVASRGRIWKWSSAGCNQPARPFPSSVLATQPPRRTGFSDGCNRMAKSSVCIR